MITLYISNFRQNEKNTIYGRKVEICSVNDLKSAVSNDYVCAKYKNNKRGNDNFIEIAFHLILIMTTQKMKRNGLNQVMSLGDFLMSSSLFIIQEIT